MIINDNDLVLFQGDSVTDAGRVREEENNLGYGYPMMAAAWFAAEHIDSSVKFINRGVSGDRVRDLKKRWKEDCIDLKPNLVSIMIGINDCWRRYDSNDPTSVKDFKNTYREILKSVRDNTDAKIIMIEPFVLPVHEEQKTWREDLDPKIHAVRELAREFNTYLIPMDGIINSAAILRTPEFWTQDGVHPTFEGHALIAREWLKAVKAI